MDAELKKAKEARFAVLRARCFKLNLFDPTRRMLAMVLGKAVKKNDYTLMLHPETFDLMCKYKNVHPSNTNELCVGDIRGGHIIPVRLVRGTDTNFRYVDEYQELVDELFPADENSPAS